MIGQPLQFKKRHRYLDFASQNGYFFFYNPKTEACNYAVDCREI